MVVKYLVEWMTQLSKWRQLIFLFKLAVTLTVIIVFFFLIFLLYIDTKWRYYWIAWTFKMTTNWQFQGYSLDFQPLRRYWHKMASLLKISCSKWCQNDSLHFLLRFAMSLTIISVFFFNSSCYLILILFLLKLSLDLTTDDFLINHPVWHFFKKDIIIYRGFQLKSRRVLNLKRSLPLLSNFLKKLKPNFVHFLYSIFWVTL